MKQHTPAVCSVLPRIRRDDSITTGRERVFIYIVDRTFGVHETTYACGLQHFTTHSSRRYYNYRASCLENAFTLFCPIEGGTGAFTVLSNQPKYALSPKRMLPATNHSSRVLSKLTYYKGVPAVHIQKSSLDARPLRRTRFMVTLQITPINMKVIHNIS